MYTSNQLAYQPDKLPPGCRVIVLPEEEQQAPYRLFESLPEIMTVQEAAKALGCCDKTLRELARKGAIKGVKIGSSWRIPKSALISFVEGGGYGKA